MQKVQTFGNGVARGHVASQSVTTTPVTITLVKEGICFAGVEALTIKTDKDIYYSLANEDIETTSGTSTVLQGAILPAGTSTVNWDNAKIKLQAVSEAATVEILAVYYDNLLKG